MVDYTSGWLLLLMFAPVVSTVVAGAVVAINHTFNATNTG